MRMKTALGRLPAYLRVSCSGHPNVDTGCSNRLKLIQQPLCQELFNQAAASIA